MKKINCGLLSSPTGELKIRILLGAHFTKKKLNMKKINWEFIFKNGTIAAILMILTFLLPDFHFAFDISVILTIVSLLFAILVGFFIGTATTNYLRLQTLISNANADLIQIFRLSKLIQVSSGEKIANVIDEYMIAMLDFPFLKWVPNTKKEFNEVTKAVEEVDPLNEKGLSLFSHLQNAKSDLDRTNQEISLAAEEVVSGRHWFILISLALIIATLLLSLRDGYWVFSFVNGVLLVAIYQILTLLKEVDSNVFLAEKLGYQNPQQVFQAIGKLQYYPEVAITKRWAKEPQENYRIGVYKDYPSSLEKEIKIVYKDKKVF